MSRLHWPGCRRTFLPLCGMLLGLAWTTTAHAEAFSGYLTPRRLKDVQTAADRAKRHFDFIIPSLDPKNDTPDLARRLGVRYWFYDEHIMHDFRLLRLNAAGEIVKVMDSYDADPGAFVR